MAVLSVIRYAFGRRVLMPILRNVFHAAGLGPLTLRDTYILQLTHVPALPRPFWAVVTVLAIVGAGCLLAFAAAAVLSVRERLQKAGTRGTDDAVPIFLLLAAVIYLGPVLIAGLFDRYLIPVVPLVGIGLAGLMFAPRTGHPTAAGPWRLAQGVVLVGLCVFAVGATHDYLSWNRARWKAARDVMQSQRVGPDRIDGGFEFNGMFLFDAAYVEDPAKSWWWVRDDTYQISFGPLDGYDTIATYPYSRWMGPGDNHIVVQRRHGATE